jgi:hypothetical protein
MCVLQALSVYCLSIRNVNHKSIAFVRNLSRLYCTLVIFVIHRRNRMYQTKIKLFVTYLYK